MFIIYVLVIGDGYWGNHNSAKNTVKMLLKSHGIKTFTVAYGRIGIVISMIMMGAMFTSYTVVNNYCRI